MSSFYSNNTIYELSFNSSNNWVIESSNNLNDTYTKNYSFNELQFIPNTETSHALIIGNSTNEELVRRQYLIADNGHFIETMILFIDISSSGSKSSIQFDPFDFSNGTKKHYFSSNSSPSKEFIIEYTMKDPQLFYYKNNFFIIFENKNYNIEINYFDNYDINYSEKDIITYYDKTDKIYNVINIPIQLNTTKGIKDAIIHRFNIGSTDMTNIMRNRIILQYNPDINNIHITDKNDYTVQQNSTQRKLYNKYIINKNNVVLYNDYIDGSGDYIFTYFDNKNIDLNGTISNNDFLNKNNDISMNFYKITTPADSIFIGADENNIYYSKINTQQTQQITTDIKRFSTSNFIDDASLNYTQTEDSKHNDISYNFTDEKFTIKHFLPANEYDKYHFASGYYVDSSNIPVIYALDKNNSVKKYKKFITLKSSHKIYVKKIEYVESNYLAYILNENTNNLYIYQSFDGITWNDTNYILNNSAEFIIHNKVINPILLKDFDKKLNEKVDKNQNPVSIGFNSNTSSTDNNTIGIGNHTLNDQNNGNHTIAIGSYAGYENTGINNILIGQNAGDNNNNISNVIILNAQTDISSMQQEKKVFMLNQLIIRIIYKRILVIIH